ncbi:MAG: sulfotransferase family 2 domain-containing protein [Wenzhouxiangella sp.]|nr:sulfotransferase family 2 domain-containing protein [Wenzhouxiangella sp.]
MARFVAQDGSLIVTSLKVASTTLDQAPQLRRLRNPDLLFRLAMGRFRGKLKVLFYRDPVSRTLSVFRSKILGIDRYREAGLQNIHHQVMQAAGLQAPYDFTLARDFFSRLEFSDFLEILPAIYRNDLHTLPQSEQLRFAWRGKKFMRIDFDCLVDLDRPDDACAFERRFGIALLKRNMSGEALGPDVNSAQKQKIESLYLEDLNLPSLLPAAHKRFWS